MSGDLEYQRRWRWENPERVKRTRRKHQERRKARDPLFMRLSHGRRRARCAGVRADHFATPELFAFWEEQGLTGSHCYLCDTELDWDARTEDGLATANLDHVRPLYQGGAHTLDNLQPLCRECHEVKTLADKLADSERVEIWD